MTPPVKPPVVAAAITAAIAALAFLGAVTPSALLIFSGGGVLVGSLSAVLSRGPWWRGALVGSVLGLGWAELVNAVGGDASGPIARSTFTVAVGTAFAVRLIGSPAPAFFLVPIGGILLGAMLLGAAGEVAFVAAATAVACLVTLGIAESRRRRWVAVPRRWVATAMVIVAMAVVAIFVSGLQVVVHPGDATVVDPQTVNPTIAPPWQPTPTPTATPTPTPTPTATPTPTPTATPTATPTPSPTSTVAPDPTKTTTPIPLWLIILIALLVIAVITLFVWWQLRRRRRRLLRARLESGTTRERSVGAWVWITYELRRRRRHVPAWTTPGEPLPEQLRLTVPPSVAADLEALGNLAAPAAYGWDEPTDDTAAESWLLADRVAAGLKPRHGLDARPNAAADQPDPV